MGYEDTLMVDKAREFYKIAEIEYITLDKLYRELETDKQDIELTKRHLVSLMATAEAYKLK